MDCSGCAPNAVIRPVVYNQRKIGGEVETFDFTFGLFALQDIARKEEVILPWDWDDDHLVHLIPRLLFSREFRDRMSLASLSQHLASVSSALFPLMPCSCTKRKSCAPSWMYRLACCSQPTSMGGNARRDFLDPSLVEEKVRALLVGGGRGGKKGVELSSVGFSRGWEPDPEPAVDRSDVSLFRMISVQRQ